MNTSGIYPVEHKVLIRPTEGSGSAGSLRATEKHLDDMRKIVSKQLDVKLDKERE